MIVEDKTFWDKHRDLYKAKFELILVDAKIKSYYKKDDMESLAKIWFRKTHEHLQYIIKDVQFKPNMVCLDLGCGIGRIAKVMINYCHKVIGYDISPNMIEMSKEYCEERKGISLNVVKTPRISRPDNSIDLAYSILTFQHFHSVELVIGWLETFYRVLKPGGAARIQFITKRENEPLNKTNFEGITWEPIKFVMLAQEIGFKLSKLDEKLGEDNWAWVTLQKPE